MLQKYKGYEISVTQNGQFEARLKGEQCYLTDTMKDMKAKLDHAAKKAFKPFSAWVRKNRSYYRDDDDGVKFEKVTVSSVSELTHKVYFKTEKGDNYQTNPGEVFVDSPENITRMAEVTRLKAEEGKISAALSDAEDKVKRIDVTEWLGKDNG